jgi:YaiO family outer membrane protein
MKRKFIAGVLFVLLFDFAGNAQKKVDALVSMGFGTDRFFSPQERTFDVYTFGLGYKGPKTTLLAYYNEGNLNNNMDGWSSQYELDFYHKIAKKTSYWLNYAYSNEPNFPEHRAMARIWQELGKGFLVSAGAKYYYFDQDLFTVTSGLEKYIGNYWVEGKVFMYLKDPSPRFSYQLNSRIFWKDVNYFQLSLMTGAAPDEPWRTDGLLPSNFNSHSARLSLCSYLGKKHKLQLRTGIGYTYEEYQTDVWRSRYNGGVTLIYTLF